MAVGLTWPHTYLNGDSRLPKENEVEPCLRSGKGSERGNVEQVGSQQKKQCPAEFYLGV